MQTILNFWKENIVNGYSKANYDVAKEIIYNTKDLKLIFVITMMIKF